jgi:hypothetical protein
METLPPAPPAIDLSPQLYSQLVFTLTDLLPPPLDDTPEALRARNHAAIAKVAALLPVNANEAELAAQCITARAQAEDMLRRVRQHAGDVDLVIRLNGQYASMVRTSLSVHGRLMRVQALRQKREAIEGAAAEDARALRVAQLLMLRVLHPRPGSVQAAGPIPAPVEAARVVVAPVKATCVAPGNEENVSENGMDSQEAAFETWMSKQPWSLGPEGAGETGLRKRLLEAMAKSRLGARELTANGRESPRRAK